MTANTEQQERGDRIIKRSVRISGHPTSVSMEEAFWQSLHDIAEQQGRPLSALITEIDSQRTAKMGGNLSSMLRVYALRFYRGEGGSGAAGEGLSGSAGPSTVKNNSDL